MRRSISIRPRTLLRIGVVSLFLGTVAADNPAADARSARLGSDFVIHGGTIYDGSSARPFVGDVAVSGDKIVYVGVASRNPYRGKRIIEAAGMIVAPGFIDPHTHADAFLIAKDAESRLNLPWMMQGVTTIYTGADGFGQPGGSIDVAGFFRDLEARGFGVNAAAYIGFGAVRRTVLGDEARAPSPDELHHMQSIVATAMCDGALGLSTGLFYAPQSYAHTDEVVSIAREAARRGGIYDSHQRDESTYSIGLLASTREGIEIGRAAHIPVHFAHLKALGIDVQGKAPELVRIIEAARAEGIDVTADQYPWDASATSLESALLPAWSLEGGRAGMLRRLDDPPTLAKITAEMLENLRRRGGPDQLLLTATALPWTGKRLSEIARDWGVEPIAAALRIIRNDRERAGAVVSFNMAERDIKLLMQQPWIMTSSDGSPGHPRMYATYPQKYAKYVLGEKVIDTAEFVNSSTGRVADTFKLDRRGHLRNGYFADIVLFDPAGYRPKADYVNPEKLSAGVAFLLVNGVLAVDRGKPTGNMGGRAVRKIPPTGSCTG